MFIAALVKMLPAPRTAVSTVLAGTGCYNQLVHQIFRPDQDKSEQRLVAFVSASPQAGVTLITRELGLELAEYESEKIAVIDARRLQIISHQDLEKWARLCAASNAKLSVLEHEPQAVSARPHNKRKSAWQKRASHRRECARILHKYFTSVLLDCPSLGEDSGLLPAIAEWMDGIVLVAEAGKTHRAELQRAERWIEALQGKVLGLVLNKRRYPVPAWIYKRL